MEEIQNVWEKVPTNNKGSEPHFKVILKVCLYIEYNI